FSPIDLSKLPAPQVVEELDFEVIFQELLSGFMARNREYSSIVESDPVYKAFEEVAYREMILRQDSNDKARAVMLAFARGSDLNHLAALAPVERKLIDTGDPDAEPPVPPTYESDEEFRARTQLAPEGFSVAGPEQGYRYHALKAAEVRDALSRRTAPGCIELVVLGRIGNGTPSVKALGEVEEIFSDRTVRPQGDLLTIRPADIIEYEVAAVLTVADGPSDSVVISAAKAAVRDYVTRAHALGGRVTLSGLSAAMTVEGVIDVQKSSPAENIVCELWQAPYCTVINISVVTL
ncbi:baseplate assembly protein, partial [Maridesulfovibrio hydrothermalis]